MFVSLAIPIIIIIIIIMQLYTLLVDYKHISTYVGTTCAYDKNNER